MNYGAAKSVTIADQAEVVALHESYLYLNQSIDEAFPNLKMPGSLVSYGGLYHCLKSACCWYWLKQHDGQAHDKTRETITWVIKRDLEASKQVNEPEESDSGLKYDHAIFLLLAAILNDDQPLLDEVLEHVKHGDSNRNGYQFNQAWAGMLKFRILGDREKELEQLEILKRKRSVGYCKSPSHKLATTFCNQDSKAFAAELKKSYRSEWKKLEKEGGVQVDDNGRASVTLSDRNQDHLWLWPEAAFAKLVAKSESIELPTDPLWLPPAILS